MHQLGHRNCFTIPPRTVLLSNVACVVEVGLAYVVEIELAQVVPVPIIPVNPKALLGPTALVPVSRLEGRWY